MFKEFNTADTIDPEKLDLFNTNISNLNTKMGELSSILKNTDSLKSKIDSLSNFKESIDKFKDSIDNLAVFKTDISQLYKKLTEFETNNKR
jgi:type VII secretion effector (TIGR04197 family)